MRGHGVQSSLEHGHSRTARRKLVKNRSTKHLPRASTRRFTISKKTRRANSKPSAQPGMRVKTMERTGRVRAAYWINAPDRPMTRTKYSTLYYEVYFTLKVGMPFEYGEGLDWCCPYELSTESSKKLFGVFGIDALQALEPCR